MGNIWEERKHILHEAAHPLNTAPTVAPTPDAPSNPVTGLTVKKAHNGRRKHWGGRTFRFSLTSFRVGTNFSIRRFSMAEGAVMLTIAYIASKGLGVIRQIIFNS